MSKYIYGGEDYDLYGFLHDDFFMDGTVNYRIKQEIEEIPPHEIFQETHLHIQYVRGCGKKKLEIVTNIIENFRIENCKRFCTCGEPYLHWYKFCPACGKERRRK